MLDKFFQIFYAPPEAPVTTGKPEESTIFEFLQDDDEDTTKVDEAKPKEKPLVIDTDDETDEEKEENLLEGEDEELKDIEEELEEPDEDKLELTVPVPRRQILAKYPELFKDFPYLEKAYYREQQFTEILSTIDDAKEAVEKAKTLDMFEQDLMNGNTEKLLQATKQHDTRAFNKLVDEYLPTLAKVDEKSYYHVLGTVIKSTIVSMVSEAKESNNDALRTAAQILNQFVFASSKFEPITKLSKEDTVDNTERNQLLREKQEFNKRKFEGARDDINVRIDNTLKATVQANIDPKESMTEYVRKNATRESMETLQDLIGRDKRFGVILDKLWERAHEDNYSKSSVDKIRAAYLSKVKTLLPSVIKKARNEALKGLGKRVSSDNDTPKKGPIASGRPQPRSSGKQSDKEVPKGMRTVDFFLQD